MKVPTCWVLDHPAHVQILAGFIRGGSTSDIIIACERQEVVQLLDASEGIIPRRRIIWVPRPVGRVKEIKAGKRLLKVVKELKGCKIQRMVVIGAAVELWAAKKIGISERWYISDTEVNHLAHSLALRHATHALLPQHWDQDLDNQFLLKFKGKVSRYDGLHGHIHLQPGLRPTQVSNPPRILLRRLQGGGIHDDDEILAIPDSLLEGTEVSIADENEVESPWNLPSSLKSYDGIITQSVTLASEAAIQGVPTLLLTKAKRGFLNELQKMGLPIHIENGETIEESHLEWLTGLHLTDTIDSKKWPKTRQQWSKIFGDYFQL